jgi:hypothetical protein
MYVELHARSAFSFLEGASTPEELIAVCSNLGMPAMALLDRDGLYGSPRFHLAAKKAGIKAHIGAEVTCASFSPRRHGDTEKCRETSDPTSTLTCEPIAKLRELSRKQFLSVSVSPWWIPSSAAGCLARRISKSLPPDYENEVARWAQRRSLRVEF